MIKITSQKTTIFQGGEMWTYLGHGLEPLSPLWASSTAEAESREARAGEGTKGFETRRVSEIPDDLRRSCFAFFLLPSLQCPTRKAGDRTESLDEAKPPPCHGVPPAQVRRQSRPGTPAEGSLVHPSFWRCWSVTETKSSSPAASRSSSIHVHLL